MSGKKQESEHPQDIKMLDVLIDKYYDLLKDLNEKNPKIGDFIKMIEARRKLAPVDAEQKKFWSMLEEIRKEKLDKNKSRKVKKRKAAKE